MPRKTKEINIEEDIMPLKKEKTSSTKKETIKKTKTKSTITKKSTTKKQTSKTTKKVSNTKTISKKVKPKSIQKDNTDLPIKQSFSSEFYDLPFRYNQTIIRILAQTPTNLFIYWEISDEDRETLKKQYGEYFFEITKPVLIVYNETLNYTFEIDIDDFANSWYLSVDDSNSKYKIELGRRPIPINYSYIPKYDIEKNGPLSPIQTPYIYISSSNELISPNDKILFNNTRKIKFKNVKTNNIIEKDITDFPNIYYKENKFVNIFEIYKQLYKEEIFNNSYLNNPSSGNPSSGNIAIRYK